MKQLGPYIASLALGIFLIMLGHDAIMAANPHATHETSHTQPTPSMCGPTQVIKPPTPETAEDDVPHDLPFLLSFPTTDISPAPRNWWVEPGYPADVQRALLQVFLN